MGLANSKIYCLSCVCTKRIVSVDVYIVAITSSCCQLCCMLVVTVTDEESASPQVGLGLRMAFQL